MTSKSTGAFWVTAVVLLTIVPVNAQFVIEWSTVDGGGAQSSTGGPFSLDGTIGQPDAGTPPLMSGGTLQLAGGFWPVTQVCYCLSDTNGDGLRNGEDVQAFVQCLMSGGACSCADIDQHNGLTADDIPAFVDDMLAGTPCGD